jgi:hypothetical protein
VSTNSLAAGTQPLLYQVHTCTHCGYLPTRQDFDDGAEVSPLLQAHLQSERAPELPSAAPTIALLESIGGRARVTHGAYMRVQARLMPRGAELKWIERHSAAYRAWVESIATVSDDGPPTITEATLRRLAQEHFAAAHGRDRVGSSTA